MGCGARKEFCCDGSYAGTGCTCSENVNSLISKFKPGAIIGHIYENKYVNRKHNESFSLNFVSEVLIWDDNLVTLQSLKLPNADLRYEEYGKSYPNNNEDIFQKLIREESKTYDLNNLSHAEEDILKNMKIIDFLNVDNFNNQYKIGNVILGGESWQFQKDYRGRIGEITYINNRGTEMEITWFEPFDYNEFFLEALRRGETGNLSQIDKWRKWEFCEKTQVKVNETIIPFMLVLESNIFPESLEVGQLYHCSDIPDEMSKVEIIEVDKEKRWIKVITDEYRDKLEPKMYLSNFDFQYVEGLVFHSLGELEPKWVDPYAEYEICEEETDDFGYDGEEPW